MLRSYAPRHRRYSFATAVVLALACASQQTPALEFTRPTVIAVPLPSQPRTREVIYEDSAYTFAAQDYGTAVAHERHGFFVYSKARRSWIEIVALSTEHARLGRSPDFGDIPLAIGWNYGHLRAEPYVPPWMNRGGWLNFPDRIIERSSPPAYRLDYNSRLEREVSLTTLSVLKSDLEAAFDGRRTTPLVAPDLVDRTGIRMELQNDGMIVPVRVNGGEFLRWSVDTKVPDIVVDRHATRLDTSPAIDQDRLQLMIGPVAVTKLPARFGRASAHNNLGGVLGGTLFERYIVAIDYDRERITLIESAAFNGRATGEDVPVQWRTAAPKLVAFIRGAETKPVNARLCVDTVESRPLVLRQSMNRQRVESVRIGSFQFDDLPVATEPSIPEGCDGTIGNGLLKRFHVTFDRRRQRLLLEAGALLRVPYDYDLTGMTIVANGTTFAIAAVGHNTVASNAGIEAGDVIVELDGRPVSAMTLAALRSSFVHDGRQLTVTTETRAGRRVVRLSMPVLK